jgi:multidrug resistance efflux pump
MPPEDRQRLQNDQLNLKRTLASNQAAVNRARAKSSRYSRTLTSSGAEVRSARSDLRRAGYLKK